MMLNRVQHKNILTRILKDIYTEDSIAPFLGFKGGTAAMFFYGLDRFSLDLDFDLLDHRRQESIFESMRKILDNYGTVKKDYAKRYSLFYLLSYDEKNDGAQNIKVEINKRQFGSRYHLRAYLGIPMRVMVQEDMAAHKLVAMYERMGKANRDIYDVWFFLHNNWPVNKMIVELRTSIPYAHFLQKCITALENMSDRTILSGLGELLTEKQKTWVKSKLRLETIFLLRLALNNEQLE